MRIPIRVYTDVTSFPIKRIIKIVNRKGRQLERVGDQLYIVEVI